MNPNVISRLVHAVRDRGLLDALIYVLHRALQVWFPDSIFERLHVVSQPIPTEASSSQSRGKSIVVRELLSGDIALQAFQRRPGEITDRFKQGAVCLGAFRNGALVGWLWFAGDAFRDWTYPIRVVLEPKGTSCWDFDVFVRPDARLTPVFSRLWQVALDVLRRRMIVSSVSFVSGANPSSLRAHLRLGASELGSVMVARVGAMTFVFSRRLAPHAQFSLDRNFIAQLVIRSSQHPVRQRT